MPNTRQAEKALRQSEKRRLRNKRVKSEIKTLSKKFKELLDKKDKEAAQKLLKEIQAKIDSAWNKGILHRNTAGRKKSKLFTLFNKIFTNKSTSAS
jgi:small subunit ribosomal protein S20